MTGGARSRRLALAALLVLTASGVDPLQSIYRANREGTAALERGDAESAIRAYESALEAAPDDPRLSYNLGNALARAGRLEEADRAWQRAVALGDGTLKRDAWFNRGVSALGAGAAALAARSFAEALVVDPADAEARRNLELALRQMQRQEQHQQQQQQGQQQQDRQQQDQRQQAQEDPQRDGERREQQPRDGEEQQERPVEGQGSDPSDAGNREGPRADEPGERQGEPPTDAEREMAERILDRLGEEEIDALRRALRRRAGPPPETPNERDW